MPLEHPLPPESLQLLDTTAQRALQIHDRCEWALDHGESDNPFLHEELLGEITNLRQQTQQTLLNPSIHLYLPPHEEDAIARTAAFFEDDFTDELKRAHAGEYIPELNTPRDLAHLVHLPISAARYSIRHLMHHPVTSHTHAPRTLPECHIRWMIHRDFKEVLDIEDKSFEQSWDEERLNLELRSRSTVGLVAEVREHIAGYLLYSLSPGFIHVPRYAVHPRMREQGIGSILLNKVAGKLDVYRRCRLLLTAPESNENGAIHARENDFLATAMIPNFYPESGETAVFMERACPELETALKNPSTVAA